MTIKKILDKEGEHLMLTAIKTAAMLILPILLSMILYVLVSLNTSIIVSVSNQCNYEKYNDNRSMKIEQKDICQDLIIKDHDMRIIKLEVAE